MEHARASLCASLTGWWRFAPLGRRAPPQQICATVAARQRGLTRRRYEQSNEILTALENPDLSKGERNPRRSRLWVLLLWRSAQREAHSAALKSGPQGSSRVGL